MKKKMNENVGESKIGLLQFEARDLERPNHSTFKSDKHSESANIVL